MPRSAAALSLSASSQSPIASSASIWFATSRGLSIPYRRIASSPSCPSRADSRSRPSIVSTSVRWTVRSLQADAIADLLGELQGLTKMGDTLLTAAEVGEVAAEHRERSDLRLACADIPSERERLFADRQRLRMAPGHPQHPRERPQRIRALRRGRLRRHELDRTLDRGEASVFTAGLLEVLAEAHMEEGRTVRVALADDLDRSPAQLDRARGGADLAGELGRPGAELGEVEPGELGRVRHRVPERERPLEVRVAPPPVRRRPPPRVPRRPTRRAPPCCDPPPPSAARAPPPTRLRCARALRPASRAAPRARRGGSSRRSPPPGARGGSGSCRSPARRRGRRAPLPGAATRARRAPEAP